MISLVGSTISHYRILDKLGEGGMGIIYRAEDLKLKRTVALKVLTESFMQSDESKRRFILEAQSASLLQHNNICTIHDIDETPEGQLFIAMDCYEGETLKQKMYRGRLGLDEIVEITRQIAEGLKKAHENGIIHRDIKPANIFITKDDTVKILDFGLAKRMDRTQLTIGRAQLGTTEYMSPEQIEGKQVDQRTDIWSLGIMLYEMLAGRPPFQADYEQAVVYLILNQEPEPINNLREDVPRTLVEIIGRSLAKEREDRYDNIASFLEELRRIKSWEVIPTSRYELPSPRPSQSIAVLPFVNLSADPEQDLFCDGLTEELITTLSRISDLKVVARTSAFAFKGGGYDLRKAGRKLDVRTVLEGSVRKSGDRLRIAAQLINVDDGYHIWSDRYDRQMKDIFDVQEEISLAIVDALKVKLLETEKGKLLRRYTDNIEAYNLCQQGWYLINKVAYNLIDKGAEYFLQAIDKDPCCAPAYSGLFTIYFSWAYFGMKRNIEMRPLMWECINKMLEIDDNFPMAYYAMGNEWGVMEFRQAEAQPAYERALQLNPNDTLTLQMYCVQRVSAGQFDYARKLAQRAKSIDPLSDLTDLCLAFPDFYLGKYELFLDAMSKYAHANPPFLWGKWFLWRALSFAGRKAEAVDVCKSMFADLGVMPVVQAMESAGIDGVFRAAACTLAEIFKQQYLSPYDIAILSSHAGNQEEALRWVGISVKEQDPKLHFLNVDPEWRGIHGDPLFEGWVKMVGWGHE